MQTIQVFEHERLTIHKDENGRKLTNSQLKALCRFNDKNHNKYFTVIRNGVKFGNYVGVIQIGGLALEILPKADRDNITPGNQESKTLCWRIVLLKMLSTTRSLRIETVSESILKKRHNSILDLYFEIYLKEVENLIHGGLIKQYRKTANNIRTLKGQLLFAQNVRKNLIHKEQFYTNHQVYDHQHLINQILLNGLFIVKDLSNLPSLADRINRVLLSFPNIKETVITEQSFTRVRLNRKSIKYMEALSIAKMLILNYSPDIISGSENMLAILFNMDNLWEKFIFKTLKKHETEDFIVQYNQSQKFWHNRTIKPDIVIYKEGTPFIIDTKWKIINNDTPSDDDLKQMYAYNMYWDAPKSMLLYPEARSSVSNHFRSFHKGRTGDNFCKTGFVSVLDETGNLNPNIGMEIIRLLN
ncbi:McrC family protein [Marinilabilia salmonicolor]|uniref:5-methylcytosine-specific restriction enzyme subunit McrC n=1 Tax=Marinilabilia salmonicolor TaxID=989 RepID=A0A368V6Q0_9BACT|nr:restriction endonuclease [Marinilabilia salmonicolor]RCW36788.1 5-methylcytosine-specific restriction enzyme subunit McrC [Marinilabilia salmonicolor]